MTKKLIIALSLLLLPLLASADAVQVEIDGIYYNLIEMNGQAVVTKKPQKGSYYGSVVIPESVVYEEKKYNVTSIGIDAFRYSSHLTSVTIPNSVTSIGSEAFSDCSGLTSVTIGNSVTSIGSAAFRFCDGLTSVHITDISAWCSIVFSGINSNPLYYAHHLYLDGEEVKDLIIPNSVTTIGRYVFSGCSGLTSLTIPNSVTSIGIEAFSGCSGLTSVTIPNSVTSIGSYAFQNCSGLTSVTIPNSMTFIDNYAFSGCSGLTSVHISDLVAWCNINFIYNSNPLYYAHHLYLDGEEVKDLIIPNSVTSIGKEAFYGCSGLTSVTIPNSVISIGEKAFQDCTDLESVKSFITEPYSINKNVFPDEIYRQSTLFIPAGTKELYTRFDGWREFLHIVEMDENEKPDDPNLYKCATPTISYQYGQLSFSCETEDVTFVSEITDYDIKKSYDATLYLTATYYINVYATKEGYENSEVATATLSWLDAELETNISGGAASVRAKPVLIQSNGNTLSISGVDEGTPISIYDVSGKMVGSAKAASENTFISTSLNPGDVGLVKIGEKTIKIIMK